MPLLEITHRRDGSRSVTPYRLPLPQCASLISVAYVAAGPSLLPFITPRTDVDVNAQEVPVDETQPTSDEAQPVEVTVRELRDVDYNESWRQAGPDFDELGQTQRRHQILLTSDGRLLGRIMTFAHNQTDDVPLQAAAVHLMRDGRIATETHTDQSGHFEAAGLTPGTYSLIAQSEQGLLAYAVHVRHAEAGEVAPTDAVQLNSMATPSWDADAVVQTVERYWGMQPERTREIEPESTRIPEAVRPFTQAGTDATTLHHHRVRLQPDGRLLGRLRRLQHDTGRPIIARDIEVALYRDGELQQMSWTDEIGYFEFGDLLPGVYSLVATGSVSTGQLDKVSTESDQGLRHGFLTFGIEVVPAHESPVIQPIAFFAVPESLEIDAALIDPADLQPFLNTPTPAAGSSVSGMQPASPSGGSSGGTSGGTSGGGGGGGSGLGAGGGSLGTLLGVGAAAGLAALAAGEDDGGQIISPAVP